MTAPELIDRLRAMVARRGSALYFIALKTSGSETAYRRYLERGLTAPSENPVRDATQGWLPGSLKLVFGSGTLLAFSGLRDSMAAIRQELLSRSPKNFRKSAKSSLDSMIGSGSTPITAQAP